uniref:Uncharacterized protein n=1 Tax=Arundo donax TaxID=35708 RepID=A0A0A9CWQ1_ARUDO
MIKEDTDTKLEKEKEAYHRVVHFSLHNIKPYIRLISHINSIKQDSLQIDKIYPKKIKIKIGVSTITVDFLVLPLSVHERSSMIYNIMAYVQSACQNKMNSTTISSM